MSNNHRIQNFLNGDDNDKEKKVGPNESGDDPFHGTEKPLADLFLHTTVLFADVADFTSWASTRDPAQVFQFLQSIYGAFDALARQGEPAAGERQWRRDVGESGLGEGVFPQHRTRGGISDFGTPRTFRG